MTSDDRTRPRGASDDPLFAATVSPVAVPALDFVRRHAVEPVLEIGAGDGRWLRALRDEGLAIRGFDPHAGEGVEVGDHTHAAGADGATLLAIWPPDGPVVQAWIRAKPWDRIIVGCQWSRIIPGDALTNYALIDTLTDEGGKKGPYTFRAWRRIDA